MEYHYPESPEKGGETLRGIPKFPKAFKVIFVPFDFRRRMVVYGNSTLRIFWKLSLPYIPYQLSPFRIFGSSYVKVPPCF